MKHTLTSYIELVDILSNLPILVKEKRRRLQISQRELGRALNMSFATISRFERGEDAMLSSIIPLLKWVGEND